jgi:acyl-CoA dehydrogenase
MDFKLSQEEQLIRNAAAQFVDKQLIAREGAYLKQDELFLPPGDPPARKLDGATRALLTKRARYAGLWALGLAEDAAVPGVGNVAQALIHREFGRTILPFQPACAPALLRDSDYARAIAEGDLSLALVFDEIHLSGCVTGVTTRFRPAADAYELSNAAVAVIEPGADVFLFPAAELGTNRVCLFALERNDPGLSIGAEADLNTDATVATLTLHRCELPSARLVGYEYEIAALIAAEQLRIAARSLGMAIRCLAESIEHARNRVTFGRPLASRQAIQWMLADLSIALRTCTWLTLEAAWRADRELPYFQAAALAKKKAAKMAFEAADAAIQIHGGYGVCKEFPFEGFYREARMMRLLYGREAEMDRARGERFLKKGNGQ